MWLAGVCTRRTLNTFVVYVPVLYACAHTNESVGAGSTPYLKIKLLDDQQEGGGRLEGRFEALKDDTVDVGDVAQVRFDAGVQHSVTVVAEVLKAQGVLNFHFLDRNNFSPV